MPPGAERLNDFVLVVLLLRKATGAIESVAASGEVAGFTLCILHAVGSDHGWLRAAG